MRVFLTTSFALLLAFAAPAAAKSAAGQDAPPQAGAAQAEEAEAARLSAEIVRLFGEKKYGEALPLARRVLELRERIHGADHPAVAGAAFNLAAVLAARREFDEAEKLYLRALSLKEKEGAGADLVPYFLNLMEVQLIRRDFDRAEASLDRLDAYLRARPPKKDKASAERMKGYRCLLIGAREEEAAKKLQSTVYRLSDPERAAALDAGPAGGGRLVSVSGGVLAGRAVRRVQPAYPREARANRVSGVVVVEITVNEEGKVVVAEAVCGHPMLRAAAVDAASRWLFTPTLLEGTPVKVTGSITITFTLR